MSNGTLYSTLFTTIHDEQRPVGNIGRGSHYSVLRSVEWMDVTRTPLELPQVHDFAIIWDEDHDTRVLEAVEKIYMAGLLSPVQFIGERKGFLSVVVAAKFYFHGSESNINSYAKAIEDIAQSLADPWGSEIGCFDRSLGSTHQCFNISIIQDNEPKVLNYLKTIDSLWGLGTKEYKF
ncbi:hypothetical protein [Rheinheimera sp.]|uniref:hypothetical protein n=1 Tax=Rheinheimera sp. TaxID=1869214 RepID=UPI003D2ABBB2